MCLFLGSGGYACCMTEQWGQMRKSRVSPKGNKGNLSGNLGILQAYPLAMYAVKASTYKSANSEDQKQKLTTLTLHMQPSSG